MKTKYNEKRDYLVPMIVEIKLDSEITLILESAPPIGPNEGYLKTPEYLNNNPFKAEYS